MNFTELPLQPLISPRAVALFGDGVLLHGLIANLKDGSLAGKLHWIGAEQQTVDGVACHASLEEVEGPVTLALIVSPADELPAIFAACGKKKVRAAVIYTPELGNVEAAQSRIQAMCADAARHGLRIFGPNALGYILPHAGLNLTPIVRAVPAGNLALVSQSVAVCANILDWNHNEEFGFSAIFGPGLSAGLELPEILDYLAHDLKTESILLYLEGIRDARRFLSSVRAAAAVKPVIAVKAGQHPASAPIAAAHSGAGVDRDDAFDAALRRAGVLRVRGIGDMFSAARALTTPKKPRGNRLAIVANGGGPAVMALDLAAEMSIEQASLAPATLEKLTTLKAARWSPGNPVDVMLDASPERFVDAIHACADDPGVDGVLAIFTPNSLVDPLDFANIAIAALRDSDKPVLACLLGEVTTRPARAAFAKARFPTFRTPENAVAAFAFMVNWVSNQALLQETPSSVSSYVEPDTLGTRQIISAALAANRDRLTLPEAKSLLTAFHIAVTPTEHADSPTAAVAIANRLGYPLTMKKAIADATPGASKTTHHKLRSAAEVALAFRELSTDNPVGVHIEPHIDNLRGRWLHISIRLDRVFGPVIALSEAGIAPEIYDARSIALPPLNPRLVGEMINVPYVARLLGPLHHLPAVAQEPLREALLRVSEMACELPWIRALDITLAANNLNTIAVDARVELHALRESPDRYRHMAITPYPSQLVGHWQLKDGSPCVIRPIRPDDAVLLQDFVRGLTQQSRYFRFFSTMRELPQSSLARYTQIDFSREIMLAAIVERDGLPVMLGEANYASLAGGMICEFAVVIADDMAGRGLGSRLMRCLIDAAKAQGHAVMRGQVLADNEPMLALMEALGFSVKLTDDMDVVEVSRPL